jgi:hypothetical protein
MIYITHIRSLSVGLVIFQVNLILSLKWLPLFLFVKKSENLVDAFLKHDKPKQCHFTEVHTHMSYKINYIRNNKNLAIQT